MNDAFVRTRREALGHLGLLFGAALLPSWAPSRAESLDSGDQSARSPRVNSWVPGLQLYTLGDAPAKDLDGTLKQVAGIGFRAVELAMAYDRSAQQLRQAFSQAGLICPSIHVVAQPTPGFWSLRSDMSKLATDFNTIGASYAVLSAPLLPERVTQALNNPPAGGLDIAALSRLFGSLDGDDWKRTADLLNEKGAVLSRAGVRIAYHNHAMEFLPQAGSLNGFEILLANTDPKLVDFQLDVGWAVSAGQDLERLFQLAAGRIRLMHLKDTKQRSKQVMELASTDVGTGIVDWQKLAVLIRRADVRQLFVEQEPPFPGPPLDSVRVAYRFLSNLFEQARPA
jgi:sugar phosphate isomerase/epimerase